MLKIKPKTRECGHKVKERKNQYTVLIHEIKNKERDKLSPSISLCVCFNGIRKLDVKSTKCRR